MREPFGRVPPLLSEELAGTLSGYLAFRHRFRNLYGFELDWTRMQPLVEDIEQTLNAFESALESFLAHLPEWRD